MTTREAQAASQLLKLHSEHAGEFDPKLISPELIARCRVITGAADPDDPRDREISTRDRYQISRALTIVRDQIASGSYAH